MAKHECWDCSFMKPLEDDCHRTFYFCMFSQSPCFLEETGVCSECELGEYAEDIYQECQ